MATITVTHTGTKKSEPKDLDTSALLTLTRTKLTPFMTEADVFLDTEDEQVPGDLETKAKLADVVSGTALKIAAKKGEKPADDKPVTEDSPGTKDPGNAAPFSQNDGVLQPQLLPEASWAADHVGLADGLKDGKPVDGDKLSQMKVGQVRNLLRENRINFNKAAFGIAPGFIDDGTNLRQAANAAIQCAQVEVKPPDVNRITSISFQYTEFVSRLHRNTTTAGQSNVGVPEIFSVQGSYRTSRTTMSDKRVVTEHKSFSHLIPKAHVVFRPDKISLSDEFVKAIDGAVGDKSNRDDDKKAVELLKALEVYGQFFATDMILGGRLNYWTDKKLEDTYTESQDQNRFQFVTKARGAIDGVPVEGGAGWEIGLDNKEKQAVIQQASSLSFILVGGSESTVMPETWIPTLAKYLNWKVVGFGTHSLVPVFEFLQDEGLRSKCIKLLRRYFTGNLKFRQTVKIGALHATPFGEGLDDVKRIVQVNVNHGINVDGLQVTYELASGKRIETPWAGYRHGEHDHVVGPLEFDEEIASIETGANTLLRRVAFTTTKGRRFPASPNEYYGRGEGNETFATIEAPRVCGLVGNSGAIIDSIGLRYRDLAIGETGRRNFLLEIEPYLFPLSVPARIELTLRGALRAGKWRTDDELDTMSRDDKRNTLITALLGLSHQDGPYFWALDDGALVGRAAIVLFLLTTGLKNQEWLKSHSCAEHRDAVIKLISNSRDEPENALKPLSDGELVRWGYAIKSAMA